VTLLGEKRLAIAYYIFVGLWFNAFLLALGTFVVCSSACIWYFA